jgi:hypothetical protein
MPRRRPLPKPTHAATIAITLLAVGLLLSASAQAATLPQKVYKIFTTEYRAEIAYSSAQMQTNLAAAEKKLASTASSIDALSQSNTTAATALVDELENQFDAAGSAGLFKSVLTADNALAKLPLTRTQHKNVLAGVAYVKRVMSINTATDLARWQAASYATAREPAATKAFGGLIGLSLPSIDLPITGSNAAVKAFVKLENKASAKTSGVFNTLSSDWASWAAGFGIEAG